MQAAWHCHEGGEPTLAQIEQVIGKAKAVQAQWIAGVGGGSVLDLAKAAAGLFGAKKSPLFYQESGELKEKGIPFIAMPTTAGTGSEATINAVITNPDKKVKLSIRDKSFLARTVILDSDLLYGMPKDVLKNSGIDALVQGYESFISKNATAFTEAFAHRAMVLINDGILPAYYRPDDASLSALLIGSYYGGIALAHSRLGVIHGIAHPLGILYHVPHGLACAACFLPAIALNRDALGEKYAILSSAVGMDFSKRVEMLLKEMNISSPFKGKPLIEKDKIIQETLSSGSTAANPKPVTPADVEFLLNQIF